MKYNFLIFCIFLSAPAIAGGSGPWCLIRDEVETCNFYAADDCYNAVAAMGGDCRENFRTAGVTGDRPWCLITANRKTCNYFSSSGCRIEAQRAGGGCVPNTQRDLAGGTSGDGSQGLLSELGEGSSNLGMNP